MSQEKISSSLVSITTGYQHVLILDCSRNIGIAKRPAKLWSNLVPFLYCLSVIFTAWASLFWLSWWVHVTRGSTVLSDLQHIKKSLGMLGLNDTSQNQKSIRCLPILACLFWVDTVLCFKHIYLIFLKKSSCLSFPVIEVVVYVWVFVWVCLHIVNVFLTTSVEKDRRPGL